MKVLSDEQIKEITDTWGKAKKADILDYLVVLHTEIAFRAKVDVDQTKELVKLRRDLQAMETATDEAWKRLHTLAAKAQDFDQALQAEEQAKKRRGGLQHQLRKMADNDAGGGMNHCGVIHTEERDRTGSSTNVCPDERDTW